MLIGAARAGVFAGFGDGFGLAVDSGPPQAVQLTSPAGLGVLQKLQVICWLDDMNSFLSSLTNFNATVLIIADFPLREISKCLVALIRVSDAHLQVLHPVALL